MTRTRHISLALLAAILTLGPLAAVAKTSMFNAHLSGKEVVPVRDTQATGEAKFIVSPDATQLGFRVNVSNIENVISAELRNAPVGSDGPVVATLYTAAPGSGKATGILTTGSLTSSNLSGPFAGQSLSALTDAMAAGRIFIVVRTDDGQGAPDQKPGDFSSGEIRGQVK